MRTENELASGSVRCTIGTFAAGRTDRGNDAGANGGRTDPREHDMVDLLTGIEAQLTRRRRGSGDLIGQRESRR